MRPFFDIGIGSSGAVSSFERFRFGFVSSFELDGPGMADSFCVMVVVIYNKTKFNKTFIIIKVTILSNFFKFLSILAMSSAERFDINPDPDEIVGVEKIGNLSAFFLAVQ